MFSEKVILITGASSGIGSTLLEYFTPKAKFMITSNRRHLNEFTPFKSNPPNLEHFVADLTVDPDIQALFQHIKEKYNRIDILINFVGSSLFSHPIEDFPVAEFDQVISLNLRTPFLLTKYAIKLMKLNGEQGGNIVHYVSSSAKNISTNKAPYGSAKAGLAHFIHYAASECGQYNIKINGISPTYVFTPRHEREIEEKIKKTGKKRQEILDEILAHQILPKPMYAKDLIQVTELLASTEVITGQIYNCSMGEILSY